jgi:hypothetical protein
LINPVFRNSMLVIIFWFSRTAFAARRKRSLATKPGKIDRDQGEQSRQPQIRGFMANFIFKCPRTGMNVQYWLADKPADDFTPVTTPWLARPAAGCTSSMVRTANYRMLKNAIDPSYRSAPAHPHGELARRLSYCRRVSLASTSPKAQGRP